MIKIESFEVAYFYSDGGVMFGPIPKRYWSKKYFCNDDNMCKLAIRCSIVTTDDRKILIDTGMGDKHDGIFKYYNPENISSIFSELQKLNVDAKDITDVVLTHLHFDHSGGATMINESDESIIPTFPNATYWVSRKQYDNIKHPSLFEKDSLFIEDIEPVEKSGQLQLIDKDTKLIDNVYLKLYDGHSPGQIAVRIDSEDRSYIFVGDVIPTSTHVSLNWLSAYDNCAISAIEEKKRLLEEISRDNLRIIFCHDAYTKEGYVIKHNTNYFFQKA